MEGVKLAVDSSASSSQGQFAFLLQVSPVQKINFDIIKMDLNNSDGGKLGDLYANGTDINIIGKGKYSYNHPLITK